MSSEALESLLRSELLEKRSESSPSLSESSLSGVDADFPLVLRASDGGEG